MNEREGKTVFSDIRIACRQYGYMGTWNIEIYIEMCRNILKYIENV